LLLGIIKSDENTIVTRIFKKQKLNTEVLEALLNRFLEFGQGEKQYELDKIQFTPKVNKVLSIAAECSLRLQKKECNLEHLLLGLLYDNSGAAGGYLNEMGISFQNAKTIIDKAFDGKELLPNEPLTVQKSPVQQQKLLEDNDDLKKLKQFSVNLNEYVAKTNNIVIGREAEIQRITQILCRKNKSNPILVGEPGVGKTAIVEALAARINDGKVPEHLQGMTIFSLDIASIIAGTKFRGDFEERVKEIVNEIENREDVIVFIDEIHTIVGGNSSANLDISNIIKPSLSRNKLICIGATTLDEYKAYIRSDKALDRRFQKVQVEEPSEAETLEMLNGVVASYSQYHNISVTPQQLERIVKLSGRYLVERKFPDKALDVLDEACSKFNLNRFQLPVEAQNLENQILDLLDKKEKLVFEHKFEQALKVRKKEGELISKFEKMHESFEEIRKKRGDLTEADIDSAISTLSRVPIEKIDNNNKQSILGLENKLNNSVIGQKNAVNKLANCLKRSKLGLIDPNRPQGIFLFCGTTGVGKTYLCKCLASEIFGDKNKLFAFDMSEYMEKHTVSKLVGAPPGYIGYDKGGELTEKIRNNPHCVILFDEIEKAHSDVFNILLQIFEEGRLTDGEGHTVNFRNTIIVLTTNLGSEETSRANIGFNNHATKDKEYDTRKSIEKFFKPELINRFDDIITFNELSKEDVSIIAEHLFLKFFNNAKESVKIEFKWDRAVIDLIVSNGYSKKYGARELKRCFVNLIETPFADFYLTSQKETHTIVASVVDNKVQFNTI
jgi:ATP-dependent Clp protease ATP-binding subunit ClpC